VNQDMRRDPLTKSLEKEVGSGHEAHDSEVSSMSRRRRFPAADKRQVLTAAEACTEPGQVGALLRREGLYSSHLTTWRRPREQGVLEALTPNKRGRTARARDSLAQRVAELQRDHAPLHQKLTQAETIIAVQTKVSGLWGTSRAAIPPGERLSWRPLADEPQKSEPGRPAMHGVWRVPALIATSNTRRDH
jgi:transposase